MSEPIRPEGTTFNRQGGIVMFGKNASLPCLLGYEVELIIESFPDEGKANWDKQTDLAVTEHNESSGPFFHPIAPHAATETNRGAKEQINYAVLESQDNSVHVSKNYSVKTAPEASGATHIEMTGSGEFYFDLKAGVVKSLSMKYDIRVNEKNVNVTIPVALTYRLLSDAEIADRKKKAEAAIAAIPDSKDHRPLTHEEKQKLMAEINSGDPLLAKAARERLFQSLQDEKNAKAEQAAKADKTDKAAKALAEPQMRTWHDASGSYQVEATFVKMEAKIVTIKKADGKLAAMPLDKLSKTDQEYVEQQTKAQVDKPANPFE
jgi:hypothetical protein